MAFLLASVLAAAPPAMAQQASSGWLADCEGSIRDCLACRLQGTCGQGQPPPPEPPVSDPDCVVTRPGEDVRDGLKRALASLAERVTEITERFEGQGKAIDKSAGFVNELEEERFDRSIGSACERHGDEIERVLRDLKPLDTEDLYQDLLALRRCMVVVRKDLEAFGEKNPAMTSAVASRLTRLGDLELNADGMLIDGNYHRNKRGRMIGTLTAYENQCDFL